MWMMVKWTTSIIARSFCCDFNKLTIIFQKNAIFSSHIKEFLFLVEVGCLHYETVGNCEIYNLLTEKAETLQIWVAAKLISTTTRYDLEMRLTDYKMVISCIWQIVKLIWLNICMTVSLEELNWINFFKEQSPLCRYFDLQNTWQDSRKSLHPAKK